LTAADLLRWTLAAALVAAASSKLVGGGQSRLALRSFGIEGPRVRATVWAALVGVEGALGLAVAVAVPGASVAAAALMAFFAVGLVVALARGRGGRPCACFGSRSRIGLFAVTRAVILSVGLAALPALDDIRPAMQTWLAIGLVVALVALAAGGVALLALAREIGELRLSIAPQPALALEGEGPALGVRLELIDRFEGEPELALAFFASTTCRLCSALKPALRLIATEPGVVVEVFDEHDDRDVWQELEVPGSPYGVVLDPAGIVLAKGTFNSLAQLEGLLAFAERRRAGVAGV
jgi:hypothetical protein